MVKEGSKAVAVAAAGVCLLSYPRGLSKRSYSTSSFLRVSGIVTATRGFLFLRTSITRIIAATKTVDQRPDGIKEVLAVCIYRGESTDVILDLYLLKED